LVCARPEAAVYSGIGRPSARPPPRKEIDMRLTLKSLFLAAAMLTLGLGASALVAPPAAAAPAYPPDPC
jgi:hypothetical protein